MRLLSTKMKHFLFIGILLFVSTSVFSSHFRYGDISWRVDENDPSGRTIIFKANTGWRCCPSVYLRYSGTSSGTIGSVPQTNTGNANGAQYYSGERSYTFPANGSYRVYYSGGAKIGNLSNNANGSWYVYTTINVGSGNNSPVTSLPAIVNVQVNSSNAFNVPVADPDGDAVTYRLASSADGWPGTQPPGFSISPSGQASWNTSGTSVGQLWNAAVVIRDAQGSEILVDFIMQVTQQSNPPQIDYSLTPADGFAYQASPGQTISFPIRAFDNDPGSYVSISASGMPTGTTISPAFGTTGNPINHTFSWTPNANQFGQYLINFISQDNNGVQVSTSVSINVSLKPVFDVPPTPVSGVHNTVVTPGNTIQYTVQASDPDPADVVQIVNIEGKDMMGNKIPIYSGATLSPLPTVAGNPTSGTFSWTPTQAQWGHRHIYFTAEDSYGDRTVHEVSQLVNTPPVFASNPNNSADVGQAFSYNISVSDPDLPYGDELSIFGISLPSWLNLVDNGDGTATLSGTPTVADVGINTIVIQAEDKHHHDDPRGIITQQFNLTVNNCTLSAIAQDLTVYIDGNGSASITAQAVDNGSSASCGIGNMSLDQSTFDCNDLSATSTLGDPTLGSSSSNPGEDCANIKANNPNAGNGIYWVDPDGNGGDAPSQCYCDMTTDGGGWMLVARQKAGGPFAPYNSDLNPSFSYGTYVANPSANSDFYRAHGDVSHDEMMFAYGDMTKWLVLDPNCARATQNSSSPNCTVLASYGTARTAGQLTNVLNRGIFSEDPWIGGEGSHGDNVYYGMLWGEAGWGPGTHGSHKNNHNGLCLFVRDASKLNQSNNVNEVAVNLTVTDNNGNTASDQAVVMVLDTTAPVMASNAITIDLVDRNTYTLSQSEIDQLGGNSADNCSVTFSISQHGFDCSMVGQSVPLTLTGTDNSGNSSSVSVSVNVADPNSVCNDPPVAVCQSLTLYSDANCGATVMASAVDNGSSDPDGDVLTYSLDQSGPFSLGNHTVSLTVSDGEYTDACTAIITVLDTMAPSISCASDQVQATNGNTCGADVIIISPVIVDNCSQTGYNKSTGDIAWPLGAYSNATGSGSAAFYTNQDYEFYGAFPTANASVTLSVRYEGDINGGASEFVNLKDENGNYLDTQVSSASGIVNRSYTINASDFNAWAADGSITFTIEGPSANQTNVNSGKANMSLNLNGGISISNDYNGTADASDHYPLGTTLVTWTATDASGNSSQCTQSITVVDQTLPTALAQDVTIQLGANGNASTSAAAVDNGSNDACGIASMSLSQTSFDCSHVGANTVTLTVADNNGNLSTASATVTVEDNVAPVAVAQDITVQLDANGNASITAAQIDNGSNDACGIASLSVAPSSFTCSEVGANTVTLTVTDNNGNVSTTSATATVEDNIAPVALAQNVTVQLDANGNASTTAQAVDNGSNDACGIASLTVAPNSFTCSEVGGNTVTLTVTDNNGNVSTATATVTVKDNVAPITIAQNVTVQLDANGNASTTAQAVNNGSNDACGVASLALSQTAFDCSHLGANAVILTVTDNNGNVSTTNAYVTVEDNIAPTISCPADIDIVAQPNDCSPVVNWNAPTVWDNCSYSVSSTHQSGDRFDEGVTTITYTVTDAAGNTANCSFDVTITTTPLTLSVSSPTFIGGNNISCNGASDGSIDATAGGGCLPYSYAWSNGSTTEDVSNLSASSYGVTMTDAKGRTISQSITLTEPTPLTGGITASPQYPVNGQAAYTIYLGYGAQSINLNASASGATPGYTYSWSNAGSLSSANTSATVASPMASTNYTVTITDANGCSITHSFFIDVVDARCGKKMDKVLVCHKRSKTKKGKTTVTFHNICVSANAVPAHLAHGDYLGPCASLREKAIDEPALTSRDISLFPNPNNGQFKLHFDGEYSTRVNVRIFSITGKLVLDKQINANEMEYDVNLDISEQSKGMYLMQVIDGAFTKTIKFNKL